jgi:hypothetical protein
VALFRGTAISNESKTKVSKSFTKIVKNKFFCPKHPSLARVPEPETKKVKVLILCVFSGVLWPFKNNKNSHYTVVL